MASTYSTFPLTDSNSLKSSSTSNPHISRKIQRIIGKTENIASKVLYIGKKHYLCRRFSQRKHGQEQV